MHRVDAPAAFGTWSVKTFETKADKTKGGALDAPRLPNTSYFSLPEMLGEEMVGFLAAAGIIVGTGAACSAGAIQSSKTLRSMGVAHEIAAGGLRVSLSRFSSAQDITDLIAALIIFRDTQHRARSSSEMVNVTG